MARILVVDDEKVMVKGIRFNLENEGYTVDVGYNGRQAVELARANEYDLIILDLMMPELDGLQACMEIRAFSTVPIIMLTARGEDTDKLLGFEYGADDYITKPFHLEVLKSRVEAVMRRVYGHADEIIKYGDLVIDVTQQTVRRNGELVDLTNKEFELLVYFVRNQGVTLARETLYENIWDFADDMVDTRTVDLHVQRLRKKLDLADRITTVFRVGYRMETL